MVAVVATVAAGVAIAVANPRPLRDPSGTTRRLATGINTDSVTGDGRFLVMGTVSGVRAIELATGVERHTDAFDSVVSVGGDWVIVGRDVQSAEPAVDTRAYALWNAATGQQIPFAGDRAVDPMGVAPDGRVLEIVYPGGRVHTDGPQPACVRLVAAAETTVP